MKAVHVIALFVLLVVMGLVFAFVRRALPVQPAKTASTAAVLPARPSSPPPPAGFELDTPTQKASHRLAFERVPATAGLACIQDALGGVKVFAGVTSLRIAGNTKPSGATREIGVVFPDRYKQSDVDGFNRNAFVREILMRLPRELAGVRLLQRTMVDAGQERLAIDADADIDASGGDRLDVTLLADPRTCMPIALEYRRASTTSAGSPDTYRVELSAYRRFGGILFPTVLKTAKNGVPWEEEYDSEVQVNASFGDQYFRGPGR